MSKTLIDYAKRKRSTLLFLKNLVPLLKLDGSITLVLVYLRAILVGYFSVMVVRTRIHKFSNSQFLSFEGCLVKTMPKQFQNIV